VSISDLANLLHPSWHAERVCSVMKLHDDNTIKFYGDETGTDTKPKTRISAISGLIGRQKAWATFDRNWKKVLDAEGIDYFHAVECERGTEQFYGMDVSKRGHIVDRLVGVISNSHLQPYTYGVVVPHFRAMSEDFRRHFTDDHPDIPYYLCLTATFTYVCHHADKLPRGEQIYFLFEQQDEFENSARSYFRDLKHGGGIWPNAHRLGDCHFVPAEERDKYPGIQAADLLAYETYQHLDNYHFQPNLREGWKVRTAFKILWTKIGKQGRYFDSDGLALLDEERLKGEYEEFRVPKVRQDNGATAEGSAQRDKGETGSGESSKKAEV
jgi:hypothetical protein